MPRIAINPKTGPVSVSYTISTPTCSSVEKISPNIPTLIFLHPAYIGKSIFHPQFSDPALRRFNLIAFDTRLHGDTEGHVSLDWRSKDAADDLAAFMDALKLPPCHLLGVSMGASIALDAAASYPKKFLSIFLVSPLPLYEPVEVQAGRQEIFDCWAEGIRNPSNTDELAISDAVYGALQLAFNSSNTSIVKALVAVHVPKAMANFRPERLNEAYAVTIKFFADRTPLSAEELNRMKCPIKLLHCGGDIAYPLHYAEELQQYLFSAGVDATLQVIPGAPQFGTVTHPSLINPILHDFVMANTTTTVAPAMEDVESPFEAELAAVGYLGLGDASSEEDEIISNLEALGVSPSVP